MKIEVGSGNVYRDLGVPDADRMLVKAQLAAKISALIRRHRMSQSAASGLFGMTQPKVSAMLRGQFRGISEEKMMRCLLSLGQNVRIVVKPAKKGEAGVLSVAA